VSASYTAGVEARVAAVRARIEAAGGAGRVRLVAVTKGFGADAVAAVLAAGVTDVGENYAQELTAKAADPATAGARWSFVGRLQRNKVRLVAPVVSLWQSVDREAVAVEIGARAPGATVLVQVNVTDQPDKGGCRPEEVDGVVAAARAAGLTVGGLMAVGPGGAPEAAREPFRALVALADRLGLEERSIGMTDDLEVAVEEGSTMVRIGRALFGERPRTSLPGN
jgi:pyridoxal phosphate enzyme (YggS family)